jgi:hypothetical protein
MGRLLLPLLFFAAALAAGDLSGKWNGSLEMKTPDGDHTGTAFLELKQTGAEITGRAGPNEEEALAIRNVKLEGKRLTFEIRHEERGRLFKLALDLVDDDKLEGTIDGESDAGEKVSGKINLKKGS